jgi:hypothetical protein
MGAGVPPAQAHHSFAMFDPAHPVQMEGIVQSWQFTNPHSWLQVAVLKNGQAVVYSIEAGSPSNLIRRGWSANSFHPGDKITLVFSPLRDGGDGGSFVKATKADGTTLAQERAGAPAGQN